MSATTMDAPVVVVGGGIVGLAAARALAARGLEPVLLEREPGPAQASVRNAGGVRAQCRNVVERRLAMAAIRLWGRIEPDTGRDVEYAVGGNLRLARTEDALEALRDEAVEELEDGLEVEVWDAAALRRRAPQVGDGFAGAKYCATDGHANPILATWAFAEAAGRAGARLRTGTTVTGIEADDGRVTAALATTADGGRLRVETGTVVLAAGAWTAGLADVPVRPARNAMMVTQPVDAPFPEFISSHELQVYVRTARSGHVHVGGVFVVPDTFDQRVSAAELAHLSRATEIVPALARSRVLRAWSGTLDMSPDHLPVVGWAPGLEGCLLACGFSGHGFCLGPIVGQLIAETIADGEPSIPLGALDPARFATQPQSA